VRPGTTQGKLMYEGVKFKQHLSGEKVIASRIDGVLVSVGELETVIHEGPVRRGFHSTFHE